MHLVGCVLFLYSSLLRIFVFIVYIMKNFLCWSLICCVYCDFFCVIFLSFYYLLSLQRILISHPSISKQSHPMSSFHIPTLPIFISMLTFITLSHLTCPPLSLLFSLSPFYSLFLFPNTATPSPPLFQQTSIETFLPSLLCSVTTPFSRRVRIYLYLCLPRITSRPQSASFVMPRSTNLP